jgi:hypothetical protein
METGGGRKVGLTFFMARFSPILGKPRTAD